PAGRGHHLLRRTGARRARRLPAATPGAAPRVRAQAAGRRRARLRRSDPRRDPGAAVGRAPRARQPAAAGGPGTVGAALAPRPDAAWSRRERRSYRVNCYPVAMEFDLRALASTPLFAATGLLIAAWLAWF